MKVLFSYPEIPPINIRLGLCGTSKYRYIIVIDLEATCDYSPEPLIDYTNSEVIEFPWVLPNLVTQNYLIIITGCS